MKITIERAALSKVLGGLTKIVERRNTIPILANVLLSATDESLSLRATDLDIELTDVVPCQVEAPGAITVGAQVLSDIVRKIPDGAQILIEAIDNGARLAVKAGRSRFTLQALSAMDFPDLEQGGSSHSFAMPGESFGRLIAHTEFAISTEETRYYLNGIYLHVCETSDGPMLRAVATDGHRLARIEIVAPAGAAGMPGIIIPRKTVGELARLSEQAGKNALSLDISTNKIRATAGTTVLTSKLIDGTFPDYQRVIPTANDKRAVLETIAFKAAIERVSTVSGERGKAVKLAFESGRLSLAVKNPDSGEATDEIEIDYDDALVEIGFNARYALDIIGALGSETISIRLSDPGSPTILSSSIDDNPLCVLMPMRIS